MKSLIIAVVFSLSAIANAQMPIVLTTADSGTAQLASRVTHRDGRTYVAYIKESHMSNGDIMFTSKLSTGGSFSSPVAVTSTGKINATLQRGPEFVVAPNGTIHMVWMEQRINNSPDIFYSRGTADGKEWTAPVDISLDQQKASQDFPSIAVDSSGNVYVAWVDNRDRVAGTLDNDQIYFTRSSDGGVTWKTPKRASLPPNNIGGSCECCRTSMEASRNGNVYIAYRTNVNNLRDIFALLSLDGGDSFLQPIRLQTRPWMIMACPATGPMTTLDKNENLHVVYRSGASGKAVAFYSQLIAGLGKAIPEIPLTTLSGSSANYPDIVADGNGALTVVIQTSDGTIERRSTDGGNTWSPDVPLDGAATTQMYPAVAFDFENSELLNVWQDDRRDRSDIMFLERPYVSTVVLPKLLSLERIPQADSITLAWSSSDHDATWYEVRYNSVVIFTLDTTITLGMVSAPTITVTPITSIGRGEPRSISLASVRELDLSHGIRLSKQPALSGDAITLSIQHPTSLRWLIYDALGKCCGVVASSPSAAGHVFTVPQLPNGVYHLQCEELSASVRVLVGTK